MVARWGKRVEFLHWGWDLWWKQGGWRKAEHPNSPQHLIWADAQPLLPKAPDAVFAVVRDPVERLASEYRWQRKGRRGTKLGRLVSRLPFPIWLRSMLEVSRLNPYAYDNHLRPQDHFVAPSAVIFRLEDGLAPVMNWLSSETGATFPETPPHQLAGQGSPIDICDDDRRRIRAVYGVDYDRFSYVAPSGTLPRQDTIDWIVGWLAPGLVWLDRRGLL